MGEFGPSLAVEVLHFSLPALHELQALKLCDLEKKINKTVSLFHFHDVVARGSGSVLV